jgi:hypothetical protein
VGQEVQSRLTAQRTPAAVPPPEISPRRLARALALEAESLGDGRYLVTGGQSPHVAALEPEPDCGCRDFLARKRICKHLLAVRLAVLEPEMRAALRGLLRTGVD